ncbi:hypothetical protein [Methyloprofundus sp.]|uniref:hypothetical protein n=1 Tax=Methyloprofundus sp. TaxID=2020875 RepID=UPI003D0CB316
MQRKMLALLILFGGIVACSQVTPDIRYPDKHVSYENTGFSPWQAGQWSRYRTSSISRDGMFHLFDSSVSKGEILLLIAGREGNGYWLEMQEKEQDSVQNIAALIIADTSKGYLDYQIKALKLLEDGQEKYFSSVDLRGGKAEEQLEMVNIWLNLLVFSLHDGFYRNIQLPAGQFLAVKEVPMTVSLRLGRMSGYLWYHNTVPIFPVTKINLTTSTSEWFNTTESIELVDFGSVGQANYFSYE